MKDGTGYIKDRQLQKLTAEADRLLEIRNTENFEAINRQHTTIMIRIQGLKSQNYQSAPETDYGVSLPQHIKL